MLKGYLPVNRTTAYLEAEVLAWSIVLPDNSGTDVEGHVANAIYKDQNSYDVFLRYLDLLA